MHIATSQGCVNYVVSVLGHTKGVMFSSMWLALKLCYREGSTVAQSD